MLYEEYSRKVKKYAAVLNFIKRYRFLLIAILAFIVAAVSVLIGIRGIIYDVAACPETVRYGEAIGYEADAVFTDVHYEFVQNGSGNWSETVPSRVGEYRVRAKAEGPFGIWRYGKEYSFSVLPKETEVRVSGTTVGYGNTPAVSADLAYSDTISCSRFVYGDLSARETTVTPVLESVSVQDAAGNDVTDCYDLRPVSATIGFEQRKITVTVQDKSGIYDGTPLMFDGYELSKETPLAEGDRLVATFETQRTEAGETENIPKLCVVREDSGLDVTANYAIEIIPGKLTVEKRPLYIVTGAAEKLYDGEPLVCGEYRVQDAEKESGLLEGHTITVAELCAAVNAGDTQNLIRFAVWDGERDVTDNYSVFYDAGILHIEARPVSVTTGDGTWMYDGQFHASGQFTVAEGNESEGLIKGHSASVSAPYSVRCAGSWENKAQISISDENQNDVTQNYDISYTYGTLEITKRPILLRSADNSWIFDGKAHSENGIQVSQNSGYDLAQGDTAKTIAVTQITYAGNAENIVQACVYDADGRNVTECYLISYEWGNLEILPRPITVTAGSAEKIYDGKPLSSNEFQLSCDYGTALVEGHTGIAVNEGAQTDAGSSLNSVQSFCVFQGEKYLTENYSVTYAAGTLTVLKRPITVQSGSAEKVYDATPLKCGDFELYCEYGEALVEGQNISVQIVGERTHAGESVNTVADVRVTDGERDVTFNYSVKVELGTLRVLRRPVTVDIASGTWVYDGQSHSVNEFSLSKESPYEFITGHDVRTFSLSFVEDVGILDNELRFSVYDPDGMNITGDYEISQNFGSLQVTPRPILLQVESQEKVYDGTPLRSKSVIVSSDYTPAILEGHSLYYESSGSQTDVGTSQCGLQNIIIYDSYGVNKTFNYLVTVVKGDLLVTPRQVLFTAVSEQVYYNGEPIYRMSADVQREEGDEGLLSWHTYTLETQGSRTDVGKVANVIIEGSVRIFENDRDITFNYSISCAEGVIEVLPRPIRIKTAGAEKMYDGTPLTKHECTIISISGEYPAIVYGQKTDILYSGSQIEVGQSENTLQKVRILENGRDVTYNYDIEESYGVLTVQIPDGELEITTGSAEKVYDGESLTCSDYTLNNTLPESYIVELSCVGKRTNVGETENIVSYKVTSHAGKDVTAVVRVSLHLGTLKVTPRPIVIETNSNSWPYDGRFHWDEGHKISEISQYLLAEGEYTHTATSTVIIDIGMKKNVQTVEIYRQDGVETTGNYTISFINGVLQVTWSDYEEQGGSLDTSGQFGGGAGQGGQGGGGSSGSGVPADTVALKVKSQAGGMVYLRLMSFGDYTGRNWEQAESYGGWLDGTYCMNYLPGMLLQKTGGVVSDIQIEFLGGDYVLPYYLTGGEYDYEIQMSDILYQGDVSKIIDLQYYVYDYVSDGKLTANTGAYAAEEMAYRSFVWQNYTFVPGSTRAYLNTVIAQEDLDRSDPDIVEKVADYIQNAAKYNLSFDSGLNRESDVVVSFLRDYKEGICQHFASAAVMLYRTLGIPARYTIGFAGETVAGEWTEIYGSNAHAWVEVYIDGFGWVQVEVTGAGPVFGEGSGIEGKPNEIWICPEDEIKQYDGMPLFADTVVGSAGENAYYFRELLQEGYTYTAEFSGSQTEIGTSYSRITEFQLYAPDGSRETRINFRYGLGELTVVEEMVVTVQLYSLQKYYDGTPLRYGAHDYTVSGLPSGYHLDLSLNNIYLVDAGVLDESVVQSLPYTVSDRSGNNVTDEFVIHYEMANSLMVSRRKITVSTMSESKIYDGTPLTNSGYWISRGTLADGDEIMVLTVGSITDIGKAFNTVSEMEVYNSRGEDVTRNYEIVVSEGVLEVVSD